MNKKIKVIVTGVTGMVGEGVLHECLEHPMVESVLVVARKTCGVSHPKLQELIHQNFFDISVIENQLSGYDACYFCLGVSSVGMKEAEYFKMTHTLTLNFAQKLCKVNQNMVFCYVSGSKTDSTEKGNSMWARVKGKTENDLSRLPFKAVYNFRPGYMQPTIGMKNTLKYYKYIDWVYPIARKLAPNFVTSLAELGLAMINVTLGGYQTKTIEVKDIVALAAKV